MPAPTLVENLPDQVTNESAGIYPIDLGQYFQSDEEDEPMQFVAELANGEPLPKGMICSSDGMLTGIPAKNTAGVYTVKLTATNKAGSTSANFQLTIRENLSMTEAEHKDALKSQVWTALDQNLPIPDIAELLSREISPIEIYYLLERWSVIKIWDAFNLDEPGPLEPISLEGVSKHYVAYDRGSCLVAAPKDLFSHERTLEDGIVTAKALAREAYNRGWTMDLVGTDKLTRAAWVEIQLLNQTLGRDLEVVNYNVNENDMRSLNTAIASTLGRAL